MPQLNIAEAINRALREIMQEDERVIYIGEDVGEHGGVHGVTKGLLEAYGKERVIDTPISEIAITGTAIGAAMNGLKPIAEIMYQDFIFIAMEQLINHAAQAKFMSAGKLKVPLTIYSQFSLGRQHGPQHSQFFLSHFVNVPSINVVLPSTPYSAYGLLRNVVKQQVPTIYLVSAWEYFRFKENVPEEKFELPFGKARTLKQGKDISIISYSRTVYPSLRAAEMLEKEGISAEVIDMMTVSPLDLDTPKCSLMKTKKGLVVSDEHEPASVSSYIAQKLNESLYGKLDRPVMTLNPPFMFVPFSPALEKAYMIDENKIVNRVKEVLN
ncbi:MAG: alpha-ketoacid dehydrogenase subunit beta [Nitrososphaeria archaeon]